jgi:hypothetical protein
MKRKAKRTSNLKYWCPIVKREFSGFQWGGHRRVCRCLKQKVGGLMSDTLNYPKTIPVQLPVVVPVSEKETAKGADQIVRTVRSYVAALDEETAKLTVKVSLLTVDLAKAKSRVDEVRAERERIVSSMREIK